MPHIQTCEMTDCAYNKHKQCHAVAITVGDEKAPICDTFWAKKEMKTKWSKSTPPRTGSSQWTSTDTIFEGNIKQLIIKNRESTILWKEKLSQTSEGQ